MSKYENLPVNEAIQKLRSDIKSLKSENKKLGRRNKVNEIRKDKIQKKIKNDRENAKKYRDLKRQYKLFTSENLKNLPVKKINKKLKGESIDLGITIK